MWIFFKASNEGVPPALPGYPPGTPNMGSTFGPPMLPAAPFIPPPGLPPGPPGMMPPQFSIPPPGFGFPMGAAPQPEPVVIGKDENKFNSASNTSIYKFQRGNS